MRSLLFVPGDRPDRFAKALASGADALILDLEDSVVPARKAEARAAVREFLEAGPHPSALGARVTLAPEGEGELALPSPSGERVDTREARRGEGPSPAILVRINPLDGPFADDDLASLTGLALVGVVLPKAEGADSVRAFVARLPGVPVLPIATETPRAMFALGSYADVATHLLGLTWGAEDLPAAIGAMTSREDDGSYTAPYHLARALTLFAAHAAGVAAIETVVPDFRDLDRLRAYATRGRRDGFTGMMAIHPAQVPVINAAFTPSPEEIARAQAIVAAFAADPHAGALQLDGRMIDAPHLKAAMQVLARE